MIVIIGGDPLLRRTSRRQAGDIQDGVSMGLVTNGWELLQAA